MKDKKSLNYINNLSLHQMQYIYDRQLPTGLGDRLGCMLCVAAMAKAQDILSLKEKEPEKKEPEKEAKVFENTKVHLYWYETNEPKGAHRNYDFSEIRRYLQFPDNLIFHTKEELEKLDYPKLSWKNAELPASFAYDCIPTLAHKTFDYSNLKYRVDSDTYALAYRLITAEVKVKNLVYDSAYQIKENKKGVLHVRGGDKSNWSPEFVATTLTCMHNLKVKYSHIEDWILVTDDQHAIKLFGPLCTSFSNDIVVKSENPSHLHIAQMMRDFDILLHADIIIQHVIEGWSAFSNIPASINNIPIINTYPYMRGNLLMSFHNLGGQPKNYYRHDQLNLFLGL